MFGVQGVGCKVYSSMMPGSEGLNESAVVGCRVQGVGCRVQGVGCSAQRLVLSVEN